MESGHASIVSHMSPNAATRSLQAELAFLHTAFSSEALCSLELYHLRPAFVGDQIDEKNETSVQTSKLQLTMEHPIHILLKLKGIQNTFSAVPSLP